MGRRVRVGDAMRSLFHAQAKSVEIGDRKNVVGVDLAGFCALGLLLSTPCPSYSGAHMQWAFWQWVMGPGTVYWARVRPAAGECAASNPQHVGFGGLSFNLNEYSAFFCLFFVWPFIVSFNYSIQIFF